jgi:hypothetical protein
MAILVMIQFAHERQVRAKMLVAMDMALANQGQSKPDQESQQGGSGLTHQAAYLMQL